MQAELLQYYAQLGILERRFWWGIRYEEILDEFQGEYKAMYVLTCFDVLQ